MDLQLGAEPPCHCLHKIILSTALPDAVLFLLTVSHICSAAHSELTIIPQASSEPLRQSDALMTPSDSTQFTFLLCQILHISNRTLLTKSSVSRAQTSCNTSPVPTTLLMLYRNAQNNPQSLVTDSSFPNNQCFLDIQTECANRISQSLCKGDIATDMEHDVGLAYPESRDNLYIFSKLYFSPLAEFSLATHHPNHLEPCVFHPLSTCT